MDKNKLCSEEEKRTLNVLLVGPESSNCTTDARKHFIKLNMEKKTISKAEEVTMGKTVFGGITYKTETSTYQFVSAPSHRNYEPNMMSRAKHTDIAVLFVSVVNDHEMEIVDRQLWECTSFIMALSIKKVLVVVTNMDCTDWSQKSYETIQDASSKKFNELGFRDQNDFKCLPVSFKTDQNIQSKIEGETWWKGPCFFDALDAFKEPAKGDNIPRQMSGAINLSRCIQELVSVDLKLDDTPRDYKHWYLRAGILVLGEKYTESFKAATKAVEYGLSPDSIKENNVLYWIIQGHHNRATKDFKKAIQSYKKASESFGLKAKAVKAVSMILKEIETESEKPKIESSTTSDEQKEEECGSEKKNVASIPSHKVDVVKQEKLITKGSTKIKKQRKKKITVSATSDEQKEEECDSKKKNVASSCVIQGSEVKSMKTIKVSSNTDYVIEIEDGRTFFDGTKIMKNGIKLPQSFIECSTHQIQNYSALVSLGLSNAGILTVGDIIPIRGSDSYFAVELVKPLDIFFSLEFLTCRSQWNITGELNSWTEEYKCTVYNEWWCFIEEKFKRILRGVVNALTYLHSKGSACGNLFIFEHNSLYITADEQVRILPSMDDQTTCNEDLVKLVKILKNVLNYPCAGHDLLLTALPKDISHLFTFLKDHKLDTVPLWWLLDHVICWTPKECVDFIFSVKRFRNRDVYHALGKIMLEEDGTYWSRRIPEEEPILHGIWKKGVESETDEVEKPGYVRVYPYTKEWDIVRYMAAVYTHYNDQEYSNLRENSKEVLDMEEIEGKLRAVFPRIYEQLMKALYECRCSSAITDRDLMKLSRHYDK